MRRLRVCECASMHTSVTMLRLLAFFCLLVCFSLLFFAFLFSLSFSWGCYWFIRSELDWSFTFSFFLFTHFFLLSLRLVLSFFLSFYNPLWLHPDPCLAYGNEPSSVLLCRFLSFFLSLYRFTTNPQGQRFLSRAMRT